jgi:hypothetical protein
MREPRHCAIFTFITHHSSFSYPVFGKSHHVRCFALAIICLCAASSAHGEQLLRWKLKAGQALQVELTQKSELETTVAGKPLKMNVEMLMGLAWQVEAVDEQGIARVAQSFTRLKLKLDAPRQDPIEYDSSAQTKPTGPAKDVADALGPLIGARIFVSLNDRGEIVDVKPSDEAAKLLDSPAAARLKETFSKDGLTDLLKQSAAVLPEKAVEPGATWTVPAASQSPLGPIKLTHKYTYVGSEVRSGRPLEKISVETKLELQEAKGKLKLIEQKQSGLLFFDAQAGRFVETQIDQELTTEAPYRDTTVRAKATSALTMKVASP